MLRWDLKICPSRKLQAEKQKKKMQKKLSKNADYMRMKEEEERREAALKLEKDRIHSAHNELTRLDPEKVKAMKEQKILMTQMQIAFKSGNMKEAEMIKKRLAPDEPK